MLKIFCYYMIPTSLKSKPLTQLISLCAFRPLLCSSNQIVPQTFIPQTRWTFLFVQVCCDSSSSGPFDLLLPLYRLLFKLHPLHDVSSFSLTISSLKSSLFYRPRESLTFPWLCLSFLAFIPVEIKV